MSIAAINWVAKQRVGNSNAKALLFWLAFHHNAETGLCCPGIKTLQAEMEVGSVNTVRTAMRLLKKLGFITAQPELKNGAIYRTLYTLNLDRISAEAPAIGDRSSQVEPPSVNEGGAIDVGGSAGDPGEGQQVTPNREIEQGINREQNKEVMCAPAGNSSANAAVASAQAQTPYPEDFDQSLFDEAQREAQLAGEKTTDEPPMKEEKPKRKRSSNVQKPESVSEQVWNDFTALRTKRRAPITETALKGIQREAEKAGITLEEALSTCCERGWQGFKAEWYSRATAKSSSPAPSSGGRYLTAQERYEERMRKAGEMSDAEYMAQFLRPTPLEIEARQRKNHESA